MSVKNGINGWAGTVLRVNLSTGTITKEDTLPKYKPYIGGMGLGYKVIWDEVPLDSDPLGPASKAVFGVGPLTASGRSLLRPYERFVPVLLVQGQLHRGCAHRRSLRACDEVRRL